MSVFSDDQEEKKIPIAEQEVSKKTHLAAKAEEWGEPGVREGIYTATLMYLLSHGNDSSGSKLNFIETAKKGTRECDRRGNRMVAEERRREGLVSRNETKAV